MTGSSYFVENSALPLQVPVKTESSPSPDLVPGTINSQSLRFQFPPPAPSDSSSSRQPSEHPATLPQQASIYRFGSNAALFRPVNTWSSSAIQSEDSGPMDINLDHAMSFNDDYDDAGELMDLPSMGASDIMGGSGGSGEKPIRRRSSKACDQCRKSKCKCERSAPGEPCRSCIMLGTQCTFLGPSRKRGPPKGYIDAIEARLHQTEALLGIMISSEDPRAQTLLKDISQDPLAREIINRVDNSPYGIKGRKGGDDKSAGSSKMRHLTADLVQKTEDMSEHVSTHPSNEWQDKVTRMLKALSRDTPARHSAATPEFPAQPHGGRTLPSISTSFSGRPASYHVADQIAMSAREGSNSPGRRLRRRIDDSELPYPHSSSAPPSATFAPGRLPSGYSSPARSTKDRLGPSLRRSASDNTRESASRRSPSPTGSCSSEYGEEDLSGALGQLSLNEDEEVRFHGKASGLHLLHSTDRHDGRNEGGIWRFPKARVWPPLQPGSSKAQLQDDYSSDGLPPLATQEHLIELYFTHVHPFLPVIHRQSFQESFHAVVESPPNADTPLSASDSSFTRRPRRVPTVLLLVMFSIALRYSTNIVKPPPADRSTMWDAGDDYLDKAKRRLDSLYSQSRPATCQALLLIGYREIGIGAMAQAWTYVGMAIRMAQDLGMHRNADGWTRQELGGPLFSKGELQERRRIWYSCVIMDKYVSAYIGRPVSIFERDFDTLLPDEKDLEEHEDWLPHLESQRASQEILPRPSRLVSCFNHSAKLSAHTAMIIQAIYAVKPVSSRQGQSVFIESMLDKWFVELPIHLAYDPGAMKYPVPLPHVLTLHMQYWCSVLLLHRPFIRSRHHSEETFAEKSYELCVSAANHITSIATLYGNTYPLSDAPVFLSYYIFTASIMHITSMTAYPNDPQVALRFSKCMEILEDMEVVWPSAGRARDVLQGAKIQFDHTVKPGAPRITDRHKRAAEHSLDDTIMESGLTRSMPQNFHLRNSNYPIASASSTPMYSPTELISMQYSPASPHHPAPYFHAPSDRQWPSELVSQNHYSASTSALPQMYSTGINMARRHSAQNLDQQPRYQQYWNDYPQYNPLAARGPYPESSIAQPNHSQDQLHMFMPEQYHQSYSTNHSSNTQ